MGGTQPKKRWTRKGLAFAVGVIAWIVAASVFDYRSILGLCILAFLGLVWFVAPELESLVKGISLEAVNEALAATDEESTSSTIPSGLRNLRDELRAKLNVNPPYFVPYSVSIFVNFSNLQELLQKVGFFDGQQWINGVKWSNAEPGHRLKLGIDFVVLSSDRHGNPQLVYRSDGDSPHFLSGLDEFSRAIEEASFEHEKAQHSVLRIFTLHPSLCFGKLLSGADERDTYQIAVEVDEGWWERISNKPDVECKKEYKSTPDWPSKSVYLVLARIPRLYIHGEDTEMWTEESSKQHWTRLEELGWKRMEHAPGVEHKFFVVIRNDVDGKSSVGQRLE
jgi:hypothetical protein